MVQLPGARACAPSRAALLHPQGRKRGWTEFSCRPELLRPHHSRCCLDTIEECQKALLDMSIRQFASCVVCRLLY
ncbi:hypothetical protein EJB05_37173 [Eragrostis curvula]|uniref:Uncharacterized protein n=1 Tax=Eragrostis curvula TaxID=38414 RepID=A0A5J9TRA1_9POAL|nr:hypothetical protein EJB05_37173 [Eragrostis curvula]